MSWHRARQSTPGELALAIRHVLAILLAALKRQIAMNRDRSYSTARIPHAEQGSLPSDVQRPDLGTTHPDTRHLRGACTQTIGWSQTHRGTLMRRRGGSCLGQTLEN